MIYCMTKTLLTLATLILAAGLLGERPSGRWVVKGETTTTTRS